MTEEEKDIPNSTDIKNINDKVIIESDIKMKEVGDNKEVDKVNEKVVEVEVDKKETEVEVDKNTKVDDNKKETDVEDYQKPPESMEDPDNNYKLIDGKYYYIDESGKKYVYDPGQEDWVVVDELEEKDTDKKPDENKVTTDEEGRKYYHSDGMYLCQDPQGNVFYMDDNNEWKAWGEHATEKEDTRWYFYQGNDTFYRDQSTNTIYKLNKDKNEWEVFEGKIRKKPRINQDEEFDTDESDIEDEYLGSEAPPGAKTDPNINYDGTTYTKKDPHDNMTYEWDVNRRAWFPKLDDDFMATYQLSYGFNPDGTKNENPLKFDDDEEEEEETEEEINKKKKDKNEQKKKPGWFEMDDASNTKVYVSNLPEDMNEERFIELMQKCGLVCKETDSSKFKIKLYKDKEGNFKGDALCTYIKVESVDLALQILDGYLVDNKKIKVERAKFQQKGTYDPSLKPKKRNKKHLEKIQKKQQKLLDWRPEPMRGERGKYENTIIIRNVFDPTEFDLKAELILDLTEAMRAQCSNFGEIKRLELFDRNPEGVIKVTFKEVEAADLCLTSINERLYRNRRLKAAAWDGKEKFKIEETEAEREERLKKWDEFLEGKEENKKA